MDGMYLFYIDGLDMEMWGHGYNESSAWRDVQERLTEDEKMRVRGKSVVDARNTPQPEPVFDDMEDFDY